MYNNASCTTIGVVVGRFQIHQLHNGHKKLLQTVASKNNHVIVFIGTTQTSLTYNNPLQFIHRKEMLMAYFNEIGYKNVTCVSLPDHKYDNSWSNNLDRQISQYVKSYNDWVVKVTLYGGRDSFISCYTGQYQTELCSFGVDYESATNQRQQIHDTILNDENWRAGIIHASAKKFPVSYPTVDICVIDYNNKRLLLARKPNETKFRLPGGFVDVGDSSFEQAAKRELHEECLGIETDDYKYFGSFRIEDWRYKHEKDKIITSLFCCRYIYGNPLPNDDIDEVKWFSFIQIMQADLPLLIENEHIQLIKTIIKYINKHETTK